MNNSKVLDQFLSERIGHPVQVRYFFAHQINDERSEAQLAFRTTEDEYYILRIGRHDNLAHMIPFDHTDVKVVDKHWDARDYPRLLSVLPDYANHHTTYDSCRYFYIYKMLKQYREPRYIGYYRAARAFDTDCYVIQDIQMQEEGHRMLVTYRDLPGEKTQTTSYVFSDPLLFVNKSLRNVAIVKYLLHYHPNHAETMYRDMNYLGDRIEFMDGQNLIDMQHPQVFRQIWHTLEQRAKTV